MKESYVKNIVLVDLENTLSNSKHRMHLLKVDSIKFQKEFLNDPPNTNVINFTNSFYNNNYNINITVLSAKKEKYRKDAELWLKKNEVIYDELIMQGDKDKRKPFDFKSDFVKENRNKILLALDDVGKTCAMIADNHIPVLRIVQEK